MPRRAAPRAARRAPRVLVLVAVLGLSACQATIRVGVNVKDNGAGLVSVTAHLDHDASVFAQNVRTSDLARSGWKVTGPAPGANGGQDINATKEFASPAQAQSIVAELSGPSGPFRDLAIGSHRSFFQTTTSFRGTVDLTCGLKCFSDPQLQQALGGAPDLGIDPTRLQADAGVIVDRIFQFEIAARLPGKVQSSNAPSQASNGALWKVRLGQRAVLMAQARAWNVTHIAVVVVIALVVLAGAAVVVLRSRVLRRPAPRHRRPARAG